MRILIIFLTFLFINNCSNQNFSSPLKKKSDDMVEKPNLDNDKSISFEDFKNIGYASYVFGQKSYNGVAILSKNKIQDIEKNMREAWV